MSNNNQKLINISTFIEENLGLEEDSYIRNTNGKTIVNHSKGWALKKLGLIDPQGRININDIWDGGQQFKLQDKLSGRYTREERLKILQYAKEELKLREKFRGHKFQYSKDYTNAKKLAKEEDPNEAIILQILSAFGNRTTKLDYKQLTFLLDSFGNGFTLNLASLIHWRTTGRNRRKVLSLASKHSKAVLIRIRAHHRLIAETFDRFQSAFFKHLGGRKSYVKLIDWELPTEGDKESLAKPFINFLVFDVDYESVKDWLSKREEVIDIFHADNNEEVVKMSLAATFLYTGRYYDREHDKRLPRLALNWAYRLHFIVRDLEGSSLSIKQKLEVYSNETRTKKNEIPKEWLEKLKPPYRCTICLKELASKNDLKAELKNHGFRVV
jgi:hypothetical protein